MTIILTCVDARMDPAYFAQLELGDALVIRDVGARVTDTAVREVSMLFELMKLGGGTAPDMGLAVVQHTNCGMERFALPEVADAITKIFGTTDVVATSAIRDVRQSVSADVGRALKSVPAGISVSDRLYDVTTGQLEEIVAPAVAG